MFGLRSARSRAIFGCLVVLAFGISAVALAGTTEATGQTGRTTLWLTIGLSVAAFVVVAGVPVLVVSVLRPLAALRASARAIAAGDLEARAKVSGPEEVTSLARDFNAMTDALSAKAKEYIDTTNLTKVTIMRVDKDNRISLVNDAMCEFLGKSREEILGTPIVDYLHPEDAPSTIRAVLNMVQSKGLVTGIVSRYATPRGTRIVEWNGYPIFDEEGRYAGVHGTGRDISERKRAEEALRESEQRFRTLSDAAFEGIAIHDKGKIVDANQTYAEMFGYQPSEIIGMHALDFAAPESRDLVWQAILSGREEPLEAIGLRKDGSTFVGEILGKAIPYQGRMVTMAAIRDITERKRAEEALRESEKRYRLIAENATDVIWTMDTNLRMTYVSPSIARLRGYTVEEAMGQTVKEMLTPASLQVVKKAIAKERLIEQMEAKDPARSPTLELEQNRKDGSTVWTEIKVAFLRGEHGQVVGILGIGRDVTDRKRAEDALRESESKYRTLLGNLPQRIFFKDRDSVYISCNDNYARDLHIIPDEIAGKTDHDFYPQELAEKYRADDKRIMKSGKTEDLEERYIQDGQEVFVQTVKTPVRDGDGNVIGILGIFWDISERKRAEEALRESEEKYRRLVQDSIDGIAVVEGVQTTLVNRALLDTFGYESEEEVVGHPFTNLVSPEYRELMVERGYAREKGQDALARYEFKALRRDGSEFDADISVSRITHQGKVMRQGIIKDITERKRAEQALRTQRDKFEGVIASLADGLNVVSRDYRIHFQSKVLEDRFGDLTGKLCYEAYMARETPCESCPMEKSIATGSTQTVEMTAADGREYEVTSTPFQDIDGETKAIEIARDITDRKRAEEAVRASEEKFRNIFQSASDGIIYLDTSGRILDVNDKAVELFGGPREELLGEHFAAVGVFHRRDLPTLLTSFAAVLAGEKASVEVRIKDRKGQERFLDCSGSSLNTDGQAPPVMVVIARDITERKRAEKALQKAREEIESRVERRMQQVNGYGLTFRELAILHLVAAGESDKEIATVLGISPLTAHKHLANILDKMGAVSRTEAGVRAIREGLLE
jgi:PAS domain S-box-containing protein